MKQTLIQHIDYIQKIFGQHNIKISILDLSRTYKMKQVHLSPRYTTDVRDVIRVH